jgi:iron complex transport system substrate-binding protein
MSSFPSLRLFALLPASALAIAFSTPKVRPPHVGSALHDMRGRPVSVERPLRRVVLFAPSLWDYLTADGGSRHILATSSFQTDEIRANLLGHVYPDAENLRVVTTVGRSSAIPGDPEQLMALDTDGIVVLSNLTASLPQLGLPVVQLDLERAPYDKDMIAKWRLLGGLSGQKDRVEWLLERYKHERQRVIEAVPRADLRPTVLFVLQFQPGFWTVQPAGGQMSRILEDLGARNAISAPGVFHIGVEDLLTLDPDLIVVSNFEQGDAVPVIFATPGLQALSAVRRRRVYREPTGGSRMDGPVEQPLLMEWLAELLYPDVMPRHFRAMAKETYQAVYGGPIEDEALDETLRWDENAGSSGFARFSKSGGAAAP